MDSNGPQSALPDAHFRAPHDVRAPARQGHFGWLVALMLIALAGVAIYMFWFRNRATTTADQAGGRGAGGREVPVVAIAARQGDLPIYLNGLGTVTPFNLVTVRSRVGGQIT